MTIKMNTDQRYVGGGSCATPDEQAAHIEPQTPVPANERLVINLETPVSHEAKLTDRSAKIVGMAEAHAATLTGDSRELFCLLLGVTNRLFTQLPPDEAGTATAQTFHDLFQTWFLFYVPALTNDTDPVQLEDALTIARGLNELETTDGIIFYLETVISDLRKEVRGE